MKKTIPLILCALLLLSLASSCAQEATPEYYCTLEVTESFLNGYSESRREMTYDENWRLATDITCNNGAEYNAYQYTYNADGTIVTVTQQFNGETRGGTFHRSYDDQGNLLKEVAVENDGTAAMTNEYTYDENGNVVTHVYTPNGPVVITSTFTYDDRGRRTSHTQSTRYVDQTTEFITQTQCHYDQEGRLVREETYDSGVLAMYTDYTYDPDSGDRAGILYYSNGTLVSSTRCAFDEAGNVLVQEQFDAQGNLVIRTTRSWVQTE